MSRVFHIARRVLVGLLALVVLLVGAAVAFSRTERARSWLREEARVAIREQLGLEATFRDAEIDLFPPRGHVLDVVIEGTDGEPLLTVDRLTVGLAPAALLAGRVEIDELSIEEPRLRLVVEGGRITNLPELPRSEGERGARSETPSDIGVLAGVVEVDWRDAPGGPLLVELRDANLDMTSDPRNGDTEVRVLVASGRVEQGGVRLPLELLRGRVMHQPERSRVLVRNLRLSLGEVRVSVPSASVGTVAPFDAEGQVELAAPLELVRALPVEAPPLEGALRIAARLTRVAGRIEAAGELAVDDLVVGPEFIGENRRQTWGPHPVGDLAAIFAVTPERVAVSELVVERGREDDGRVVARDLTIDLADPELPLDAEVTLEGVELANVLIDAGIYASRVTGRIDGTTTLHGTLRGFRLRCLPLALRVRDFRVLSQSVTKPDGQLVLAIPQSTLRGKVVIDAEAVRLRDLVIAFGRTQLGVRADLGVRGPDQEFDLTAQALAGRFDLGDIGTIAGLEMLGSGQVRARIRGRYPDPSLEGSVELRDFRIGTVSFGDVRGPVTWRRTTLSLPDTHGVRGESRYRFAGARIDFRPSGVTLAGVAHLEPLHVGDFLDMFSLEQPAFRRARAAVTGEARVAYAGRGDRWTVDLAGRAEGAAYGPELLGDGEIDLTYDAGDIAIRSALFRDGEGGLAVSGTIDRDLDLDLEVAITNHPIQRIESRPDALGPVEGRLRGAARLRGRPDSLSGGGWVELSPVTYQGRRLGPSRLLFALDSGTVRAEGGLAGRMVRIEEATLRLAEHYPLRVRGSVHGLDVGALLGPGRLPAGMEVRIDGAVDAGVEFRRRPRFDGSARLDSLLVRHPAFEVRAAEPVELAFERRRVTIRTSAFDVSSRTLEGSTTFTLGGQVTETDLDLQVRGALDLGFVPSLVESIEDLRGTLSLDCEIGGPFAGPSLAGRADLRVDRLAVAGVPYPVEDLSGVLRFSEHAVLVEELRARLLGGRASATGRLSLDGLGLGAYRLDVTLRDGTLPIGARSNIVANAEVHVTSPRAEGELPLVGGRVEVVRFRYEEPIYLDANIGDLGRARVEEVRTFDPAGERIRFDVELVGGGMLQVENNLASATAIIDDSVRPFRLVGTNQSWSLLGRLVVERRGRVAFRDTELEIERGILEFEDPFDPNPRLDFVATATRRDWLITLQVGGTRREPIILFRSDPPLSEEDIALLLTVGLTREETEQLGYGGAAMSAAPEILSQLTGLDRELNRLVPVLDEIRITTDYSPRSGRPEPRVRIGRRLTEAVRIGASAGLSERRDFEANVEWEITDSLSLEGVYENETDFGLGNFGGDLRWRIEF